MKRALTLMAAAGGVLAAHAQSSVTMYGSVDVNVGQTSTTTATSLPGGGAPRPGAKTLREDSGIGPGSRLGFKGIEDLGGGLSANFLIESGFALDTGGSQQGGLMFGRQSYLGISSKSGWSISAGRQYSPIDVSISLSDALGGSYYGNALSGEGHAVYEWIGAPAGSGAFQEPGRTDNSLLGVVTVGAVTARLMVTTGQETPSHAGRVVSPAIVYETPKFSLTTGYAALRQPDQAVITGAKPEVLNEWMVGGSYDFGFARLYSQYFDLRGPQNRENVSAAAKASINAFSWLKTHSISLGARIDTSALSRLSLNVTRGTYDYGSGPLGRSTSIGVVYEYYLSKRTTFYANYGNMLNNAYANAPLVAAVVELGPNGYGSKLQVMDVGFRHTF